MGLSAPGESHIDRGVIAQLEDINSGKALYHRLGETISPRWAFSATALTGIEEMDPVLGELELLNDHSSISFLHSREDALLEEQFQDHLADLERNQRSPPVLVGLGGSTTEGVEPGESVATEAARAQKRHLAVSNWVKRVRQKELVRQARAAGTRANASSLHAVEDPTDEPVVKSDWECGDLSWEEKSQLKKPSRVNLSSWWSRFEGRNSEYAGLGYSLTLSQYARNRFAGATASNDKSKVS